MILPLNIRKQIQSNSKNNLYNPPFNKKSLFSYNNSFNNNKYLNIQND